MKISPVTGFNYYTKQNNKILYNTESEKMQNPMLSPKNISFGINSFGDLFSFVRVKANEERRESRRRQIEKTIEKVTNDVKLVSEKLGIPYDEAGELYGKYIELGGIKPDETGWNKGLNNVVGHSEEKLELIKNVVSPIVLMLKNTDDEQKIESYKKAVPNGVLIFGVKGAGKTFLTESLFEHFKTVAEQKNINLETVDMSEYIDSDDEQALVEFIKNTFENAESWDGKKHTVIFIRNLDKYVQSGNENVLTELAFQMTGAKDKGITWIAETDMGAYLPDWIFSPGRLNYAKSINNLAENEQSAMMSYFWAKLGRYDKSDHEEILNYCKMNAITLAPPMFVQIADNVEKRLSELDKNYMDEPAYIAPVTTEDVIKAIIDYSHEQEKLPVDYYGSPYSNPETERIIWMKMGKYMDSDEQHS